MDPQHPVAYVSYEEADIQTQLQQEMGRTFGEEETCFAQDAEEDEGVQTDTVVRVSEGDMVDTARDLPRLPIPTGSTMGRAPAHYPHTAEGRWWYVSAEEYAAADRDMKNTFDDVGRIMETKLGVERTGDERCSASVPWREC